MVQNTQTGNFIILAGIVVSVAQHYSVVLNQNDVVSVLAAGAILYGWFHSFMVTRKITKVAIAAGVKGIK